MLKKFSPQSKSFLILFTIAVVGTYLTAMISRDTSTMLDNRQNGYVSIYYPSNTAQAAEPNLPSVAPVDTSAWKTYTDSAYPLSFQYAPAWKVLPGKKTSDGFYTLEIDPGAKYYNIKIHISPSGYYALDSLEPVPSTVAGLPAQDVANILFGVQYGGNYYTFDNGLSTNLIDSFNALVKSVKFQ